MSALYTELLTGLAKHLGLPEASLLAETQELVIDDLKIGFDYEPIDANEPVYGDALFFCVLGRPAAERQAAIHRLMLEGNNLWAGTGGGTLGLQQDTGTAILAARLPVETTTPENFASVLANFAEVAVFWRGIIEGKIGVDAAADSFSMLGQRA
jgi:hypothetical protein